MQCNIVTSLVYPGFLCDLPWVIGCSSVGVGIAGRPQPSHGRRSGLEEVTAADGTVIAAGGGYGHFYVHPAITQIMISFFKVLVVQGWENITDTLSI